SDVPGYAAVVPVADLISADYNCNIRRYADNAPPPEPQDVRAHLVGGVPKTEVLAEDKRELFRSHGVEVSTFFLERDADHHDFVPAITDRSRIKEVLESDSGLRKKEERLSARFAECWEGRLPTLRGWPQCRNLMQERATLLDSFVYALKPIALLGPFEVAGV